MKMAVFLLLFILIPLVFTLIVTGSSKPAKRRPGGGDASSPFIFGNYSDSGSCDSFGGGFGGDGGGCGGGGE
jgi:hypothetical protein